MQGLSLDKKPEPAQSPLDKALDQGIAAIGGQERKIVKAKRNTDNGKRVQQEKER